MTQPGDFTMSIPTGIDQPEHVLILRPGNVLVLRYTPGRYSLQELQDVRDRFQAGLCGTGVQGVIVEAEDWAVVVP